MGTNARVLPEHIAEEQPVIHPALDWRDGILIMGLKLEHERRGVITSQGELLMPDQLPWPICKQAHGFSRSPVTERVADRYLKGYGVPGNPESAYALVNVPSRMAAYYRRFVAFPFDWWPDVLAVWTLGTYVYPIFNAYPYVRITSPVPGCGKSLLGQLIANLSFNGELLVSPTEANIFRLAESDRGTQVWDEVEGNHEIERSRLQLMKSVLLNGYRAGGAVPRQERGAGGKFATVRFHVYVPRVLIGLSDLPEVVEQRTIEVLLQKRSASDAVERYTASDHEVEETELRELCALFALTYRSRIHHVYRRSNLAESLERRIGAVGRLTDDLLLPVFSVAAAPVDSDERSRAALVPMLQRMMHQAAPAIADRWCEREQSSCGNSWLAAALHILEEHGELTPTALAERLREVTRIERTSEWVSRKLVKYGIRTRKKSGRRVFEVTAEELRELRVRYNLDRERESERQPAAPA